MFIFVIIYYIKLIYLIICSDIYSGRPTDGNWIMTITGTNFDISSQNGTIKFDNIVLLPLSWTPTLVTVLIPPGAGSRHNISVVTYMGVASNALLMDYNTPQIVTTNLTLATDNGPTAMGSTD